ncbi:exonuclease SbcCD subunit D [Brucella haematophila]|uniref:exonuclease SbcCD subunit D n=1 Tax=Brucella haematophila TaxID=419474 RepID=UPI00110D829D|nr:exonuclease SbcCD subunit D [Brucella haematophila]TMV04467.1 exonuclease SbcCD subunit D [Brucella haematophila]
MKFLHTADLHLGRQFNGISLEADHGAVLDQIVEAVHVHQPNALIIAGDIFDRAAPPATAVRQFNTFMRRISKETDAAVLLIAGNHDSADRIESMSVLTDTRRGIIRGMISADERPFVLHDDHGPVVFSGLPFSYEYAARECFGDETLATPEDVLKAQVAAARKHVPDGARWVILAHAFVAGAEPSDAERPLARVGGIETVNPDIFSGASYVALGHLHRPQTAGGDHIRYSGAPLAFGFDEADHVKSMNLVEIDADGAVTIEEIPFQPIRQVRILKGRHAELLAFPRSDDFIKAILTDETPIIEAMKRLREVFPNACQLTYQRDERSIAQKSLSISDFQAIKPMDLVAAFVEQVRADPITETERDVVETALSDLHQSEGTA